MKTLACILALMLITITAVSGQSGRGPAPAFAAPATSAGAPDADGFIRRWLVLEPIPIQIRSNAQLNDSFVQTTVKTDYFADQYTVIPCDGDKVTVNGAELLWHAVDTRAYHVNLYHFARALKKPAFNILFWAVTIVHCPEEMRNVRLSVDCNAA